MCPEEDMPRKCVCVCQADTKLRQSESFGLLRRINGPILAYLFEKYQVSSAQRMVKTSQNVRFPF